MQSFSCSNIFLFKCLFNANNLLLQIPHLQFVRSKLLPTKHFCSLWKKCHNIKTERFGRHHRLQAVLWRDHLTECQRAETEAAVVRGKRCSPIFVFHHSNLSESMSGTVAVRHCWTSLSLSSDGSVRARQLHVSAAYKEAGLICGQLCCVCADKNSWKHQNCFCLTPPGTNTPVTPGEGGIYLII